MTKAQFQALEEMVKQQHEVLQQLQQELNLEKQKKVEMPSNLIELLSGNGTPPPPQFTFAADQWEQWILRFEQFRTTTPLRLLPEDQQVQKLLYIMGGKANAILDTFKLTESEKANYNTVKEKFDNHYIAKKTKMYMRVRFNSRIQLATETVDQFVTEVHTLGKKCEYGNMTDELVRDRLIVGIQNKTLSLALQNNEKELSLEEVVERIRHAEVVQQNQKLIQAPSQEIGAIGKSKKKAITFNASKSTYQGKQDPKNNKNPKSNYTSNPKQKQQANQNQQYNHNPAQSQHQQQQGQRCGWCGDPDRHPKEKCPARDDDCGYCGILGHWSSACHKKRIAAGKRFNNVNFNEPQGQDAHSRMEIPVDSFLFGVVEFSNPVSNINNISTKQKVDPIPPIFREVQVNGQSLKFKIDTGADGTVVGPQHLQTLRNMPLIQPEWTTLHGPDKSCLESRGAIKSVTMSYKDQKVISDIHVVKGVETPLLGRTESIILGFITVEPEEMLRIQEIIKDKQNQKNQDQKIQEKKQHQEQENQEYNGDQQPEVIFKSVFKGLGKVPGCYKIQLQPMAKPKAVTVARQVSIPLRKPVEEALVNMQSDDIIERVDHPTEWCSHMCPVIKKKPDAQGNFPPGAIRITVDYAALNEAVEREIFQLPTVEECLARMAGCKFFSKLDANQGYHQVQLHEECRDLTTFTTHIGRFRYKRLPMGLKSSSEVYQKKMTEIIGGIKGVINLMDDCLIGGKTIQEHDQILYQILQRFKKNNITLNKDKCEIRVKECVVLGQRISAEGISPLTSKVKAIQEMPPPKDITQLRSFLGAVNHLMKFLPRLADLDHPLRDLLKKDSLMQWSEEHQQAFEDIKKLLIKPPILAWYDPTLPTRVTADASSYGIGAVLEQQCPEDKEWRPVHFLSLSMSPTQLRYSMIEKEACAIVTTCERLEMYLKGLPHFLIRTDHKPLVPILQTKTLSDLSVRLQRFRMRLTPFWYTVEHIPGKFNYVADTLSRMPLPAQEEDKDVIQDLISIPDEEVILTITLQTPITAPKIKKIAEAQKEDMKSQTIRDYIKDGWPQHKPASKEISLFVEHKADLTLTGDLITYKTRLYIPDSMQQEILTNIHEGHFPIHKCLARARMAVWWPEIKKDIMKKSAECPTCVEHTKQRPEPLMPSRIPEHPWDIIGADVGTLEGTDYLIIIDAYSKYPFFFQLPNMSSKTTIEKFKMLFHMFGSPTTLRTDRGTNFASSEFQQFCQEYNIEHLMSSSEHHQGNGLAEAGVKLVKELIKKNPYDAGKAMMEHRATPNDSGYSPGQLFLGRQIKTTLPSLQSPLLLTPSIKKHKLFLQQRRNKAKEYFDKRHQAKELPELEDGARVWVPDAQQYGRVNQTLRPRSYAITTGNGTKIIRNRRDLVQAAPSQEPAGDQEPINTTPETTPEARRSGRSRQPTKKAQESYMQLQV